MFLNLCVIVLTATQIIVCLLLVLLVLMQRPRHEGLSPAIGGGITDAIWGPQTNSVLHKGTVSLGVLLFVLSLALSMVKSAQVHEWSRLEMKSVPAANPVSPESAHEIIRAPGGALFR
ncbi:MAG TPA: preprotein translocase subunit SecG [Verrucomicrobiales bacterium]|nr:preprotein translocase subunit SecG [Verrucomicrobiales bacterium]